MNSPRAPTWCQGFWAYSLGQASFAGYFLADMAAGLSLRDFDLVGGLIQDVCFRNAANYFGFDLPERGVEGRGQPRQLWPRPGAEQPSATAGAVLFVAPVLTRPHPGAAAPRTPLVGAAARRIVVGAAALAVSTRLEPRPPAREPS